MPLPAGAGEAGAFELEWKVVSPDGHTVRGRIAFRVEVGPDAAAAPRAEPAPPADSAAVAEGEPTPPAVGAVETEDGPEIGRPVWGVFLHGAARGALLAAAGCLVFLGWIRLPLPATYGRRTLALAALAAGLLAADLGTWAAGVASPDAAGVAAALGSRAGAVGAVRLGLAVLALGALGLARRPALAAAFAAAAVLLDGATGHPAASRPALTIPLKSIHLAAASVWLGGLLALVGSGSEEAYRRRAQGVSSAALAAVAAVAVTGVAEAALFLPAISDLFGSPYGRLVLAKGTGLLALVAFGAYHRFRLIPRLASGSAPALRRSVRGEAAVLLAVVLLAALLGHVSPPAAEAGAVAASRAADP